MVGSRQIREGRAETETEGRGARQKGTWKKEKRVEERGEILGGWVAEK